MPLYNDGRFETLILSRRRIPDEARGYMSGDPRIKVLEQARIKCEVFDVPSESTVIENLNEVSDGVADFDYW